MSLDMSSICPGMPCTGSERHRLCEAWHVPRPSGRGEHESMVQQSCVWRFCLSLFICGIFLTQKRQEWDGRCLESRWKLSFVAGWRLAEMPKSDSWKGHSSVFGVFWQVDGFFDYCGCVILCAKGQMVTWHTAASESLVVTISAFSARCKVDPLTVLQCIQGVRVLIFSILAMFEICYDIP